MYRKRSLSQQQVSGQEGSTLMETNSLIRQVAIRQSA